jgi:hypothetical protein
MYDCILRFMLGVILALVDGAHERERRSVQRCNALVARLKEGDALSRATRRLGELLVEVEEDGPRQALVLLHEAANVAERVRLRLEQAAHDGDVDEAAAEQRRDGASGQSGPAHQCSVKRACLAGTHIFSLLGLSRAQSSFSRLLTQLECR